MSKLAKIETTVALFILCFTIFGIPAFGQETPGDYQEVLKYLDRKGDFSAGVLKVNIPRNDIQVSIAGTSTPTPFGFGGWVAVTKGEGGADVMMGDLVLLQDEVNSFAFAQRATIQKADHGGRALAALRSCEKGK